MLITYKKVNDAFQRLDDKWHGVKYGIGYAFRIGNKICITYNSKPILWIDKKNQYQFTSIKNEVVRQFYNKYTPITIRKRKAGWYIGHMPFHMNMKVDSKGDFIIPEVWPPPNHTIHCIDCYETYSHELCTDCYRNFINGEARW